MVQVCGVLECGEVVLKGELIGKVIVIVGGLCEGFDFEVGGELVVNFDCFYVYMLMCLMEVNLKNDVGKFEEVFELLCNIKFGWDVIVF